MRIRVRHVTRYQYEGTARSVMQLLRLTPRPHAGQQVVDWRLDADADVRLRWSEDAFGNIVHHLSSERALQALTVTVTGEVVTTETAGVVAGSVERLPDEVYLRVTPRTRPDAAIADFARRVDPGEGAGLLGRLHALMSAVSETVAFDTEATDVRGGAAEAFALRRGVCQDHAHIFIAAARCLELPARYVSGHLVRSDGVLAQEAMHAWAEAKAPDLGWVGFDAANGVSPTEAYVRVATGLDYLDAAPVRGAWTGGGEERLTVEVSASQVQPPRPRRGPSQAQSQSQS
ncbi:MAG: transglutaminase family protein [Phenylobacterium sp.]